MLPIRNFLLPLVSFAISSGVPTAVLAQACPDEGPFGDITKFDTYGSSNGVTITPAVVSDAAGVCGDAFEIAVADPLPGNTFAGGFQVRQDDAVVDEAGRSYRVSFRYRADAVRDFNFVLNSRRFNTFGSDDDTYVSRGFSATTTYQTFTQTITSVRTPADGTDYRLYFLVAVANSATSLYLDDVVIEEVTVPATSFSVSPAGDDGNPGSVANPWRTLTYAFTQLAPGDTLTLADGVYPEQCTLRNLVATAADPTVIRAANRWQAAIVGQAQFPTLLEVADCSHVLIEGLEVYHPGATTDDDWATGIQAFSSDHVTIRDNYVHDCGCNGISGRESDYVTVERNVVRDNAKTNPFNCSGISIYQPIALDQAPGPHIVVRENVAFANECDLPFTPQGFTTPTDGNGIILDDFNWTQLREDGSSEAPYLREALVENNLAFDNGGAGVKVFQVESATLRHNTAYHNSRILANYPAVESGEFGVEGTAGTITLVNNIAVQAPGRSSFATAFNNFGLGGTLVSTTNVVVGARVSNDPIQSQGDLAVGESQQGYPGLLAPATAPPAFASVDDFRPRFGLGSGSPALDAATAAQASANDLEGAPRATPDIGAYEGIGTSAPLPAVLTHFGARALAGGAVAVTWATATEVGARDFVVERSGDADEAWSAVATVPARGPGDYAVTDATAGAAVAKTLYYRLRQRDRDGAEVVSAAVAVALDGAAAALLAGGNVLAAGEALHVNAGEGAAVAVFRADGAVVARLRVRGATVALPTLAAGVYVVRAGDGRAGRVLVR